MDSESYQALERARQVQNQRRNEHSNALREWAPLKGAVIRSRAQPGSETFARFDRARDVVVKAEKALEEASREVQRLMDAGAVEQNAMTRRLM